jgi:hypothetical protein
MESFKLKVEKRNKLYFNKYRYKTVLVIPGAGYTYYINDIDTFVARTEKLRDNNNRYGVRILTNSWKEYWDEINIEKISKFITWRNVVSKEKCMYRMQGDSVSFFSNDLSLLQTLKSIDEKASFYEVQCYDSPDTLYFKREPKYKFRTYFRSKRMPKNFSENVRDLSEIYKDSLHFCPALFRALFVKSQYNPYRYMHGSYYVEYNDEKMLTILSMWFPDMLAKTYSLAKEQ